MSICNNHLSQSLNQTITTQYCGVYITSPIMLCIFIRMSISFLNNTKQISQHLKQDNHQHQLKHQQ